MADNSTAPAFAEQWRNPAGFLALLMIIGGPVIQSALAQLTGPPFVPISFSFGWVSYAFSTINALVGDGCLMPPADYACKVINLENGYTRTNRSWIIGRLLRDLEKPLSNEAMRVEVYEAVEPPDGNVLAGGKSRWFGMGVILIQIGISIVPFVRFGDWGIFMITVLGTCAALATAALPQWRVEKLACRVKSKKTIAITTGNGSRHVVVILGEGKSLDLEDLAAGEGPRQARPWIKSGWFVRYVNEKGEVKRVSRIQAFREYMQERGIESKPPILLTGTWLGIRYFQWYRGNKRNKPVARASRNEVMEAYMKKRNLREEVKLFRSLPLPFLLTRLFCGILILHWAVVLISVLALKEKTWYLVAVGTIGMIQNAICAAASRRPETRGIYLKRDPMVFIGDKVMDVLMDLDRWKPGCGRSLLKEFFPAGLDIPKDRGESDWWDGKERIDKGNRAAGEGEGRRRNAKSEKKTAEGKDKDRYDKNRYEEENCGSRYDKEEVEKPGTSSRGKRGV